MKMNDIAEITIHTANPLVFDKYTELNSCRMFPTEFQIHYLEMQYQVQLIPCLAI